MGGPLRTFVGGVRADGLSTVPEEVRRAAREAGHNYGFDASVVTYKVVLDGVIGRSVQRRDAAGEGAQVGEIVAALDDNLEEVAVLWESEHGTTGAPTRERFDDLRRA